MGITPETLTALSPRAAKIMGRRLGRKSCEVRPGAYIVEEGGQTWFQTRRSALCSCRDCFA